MSRTLLILLATPVLLVVIAALLIPVLLDEEKLLAMAADTLEKETGAVLLVKGGASLSIFPNLSLQLGDASITMPGEQEMALKAGSLGIGLELMPLLSREIEIADISIDGLVMTIQAAPEQPALDTSTLSDEQLDEFYSKRREALGSANQAAGQESIAALPLALNVQRLSVTNSMLEMVSADNTETTRVKIVMLEAKGLNPDDRSMPINLHIQLDGEEGAPPVDVTLEGAVRVDAASQQLALENIAVSVKGVMAERVTLQASGVVELMKQAADLQIELVLGDMRGDGSVRYASFETPQINAKLHLNKFDPALLALAGPDAAAAADSSASNGGADGDQALPLNAIRAIDTKAILKIDSANFSGHVVKKVRANLRVVDGIVRLNSLTGTVHGGELDMKATFNAKHNTAKLTTKGGLKNMDLAMALEAMGSEPIVTGKANLGWRLNSSGSTANQLIEAMRGPIDLQTSEVVLQSLGIEKMLCEAVALANHESLTKQLPDITRFENLSVKLRMDKGKVQLKPLRAELSKVMLSGEGALDLLQQDFKVSFKATLSEDMGELDPACRVNDRLTAIAWPINCKGKLAGDPADWCGVDSQKIIEDLATKEVQHQLEKEGSKLLDKLFKR
ncbi:MAG: AsmA family protein [Proteobacteria bacterium]|nr:AsmA family protein [Pseudomonadota bacterium]